MSGCSAPPANLLSVAEIAAINIDSQRQDYYLGVGDKIALKFFYHDKLNQEQTIRPDGKLALPLVPELVAAGLTPSQLAAQVARSYGTAKQDLQPGEVTVIVKEFGSQQVFVGGEVARPGLVKLTGRMRTLEVLTVVGGPRDTAHLGNVILMRYAGTAKPQIYVLDLTRVLQGEQPDIILKAYDAVYVPKTRIANVNLFVEQYFHKLIPAQISFIYGLDSLVVR
jgi:protein involved in polysaccharide export with SLBB domain